MSPAAKVESTNNEATPQRLVIRHSESRARKNALERERTVAKLQQRLTQGIKGNGKAERFLRVDHGAVTLDHEAIERDARYDGLHGVWTSLDRKRYAAQDIYAYYGQLWRIEDGFRILKHTMMTRPIYHWTPRRVRAHMAICFVAFALLRLLRYQYNCMQVRSRSAKRASWKRSPTFKPPYSLTPAR